MLLNRLYNWFISLFYKNIINTEVSKTFCEKIVTKQEGERSPAVEENLICHICGNTFKCYVNPNIYHPYKTGECNKCLDDVKRRERFRDFYRKEFLSEYYE